MERDIGVSILGSDIVPCMLTLFFLYTDNGNG